MLRFSMLILAINAAVVGPVIALLWYFLGTQKAGHLYAVVAYLCIAGLLYLVRHFVPREAEHLLREEL